MRELTKAGVLVGFAGGSGTPLYNADEIDIEAAWCQPQSEYRLTEYLQACVRFWFDCELRLVAADAPAAAPVRPCAKLDSRWTPHACMR
jgi:CRISPR-associated protein Cas1